MAVGNPGKRQDARLLAARGELSPRQRQAMLLARCAGLPAEPPSGAASAARPAEAGSMSLHGPAERYRNEALSLLREKQRANTLTAYESALLEGYSAFPSNPYAARLVAKERIGLLSEKESALLAGFREFPQSKTHGVARLVAKERLGTLDPSEQAILAGCREFPQNPEAADLAARERLGALMPEEADALKRWRCPEPGSAMYPSLW
jgi:hypothetical protein